MLPTTRKYFVKIIQRLPFQYLKKVAHFYTNVVFEEILSLVLDKVSLWKYPLYHLFFWFFFYTIDLQKHNTKSKIY